MCGAAAKDFSEMAALRFLLGIFESAITPTFVLINSYAKLYPAILAKVHLLTVNTTVCGT